MVAYSAGTRLLSRALADLALEEMGNSRAVIRSKLRGNDAAFGKHLAYLIRA